MSPLTPRITDAEVDALPLDEALAGLLDELCASRDEFTPAQQAQQAQRSQRLGRSRRRWPLVAAAAASIAVVVIVPTLLGGHDPDPVAPRPVPQPASQSTSTGRGVDDPGDLTAPEPEPWTAPSNLYALAAPGWSVDPGQVHSDRTGVSVTYVSGGKQFTLSWVTPRTWHRLAEDPVGDGGSVSMIRFDGAERRYVTYESQQQMVFVAPVRGYGLRIDAAFTTPAEFETLLAATRPVRTLRLPAGVVGPAGEEAAVEAALQGVDLPDGFEPPRLVGWNGRYQVAAEVVTRVGCAWARHYVDGGTRAAQLEALSAMRRSAQWPVLAGPPVSWPGWFADTTRFMRQGAPDEQILGSAGC